MTTRNKSNELFDIPDNLHQRCQRKLGWDEEFAGRAILGYRQWILMIAELQDWDATKLWPSSAVHLVWQEHILEVKHYIDACTKYTAGHGVTPGVVIGHNPGGEVDEETRQRRIETTKLALVATFREDYDRVIWLFDDPPSKKQAAVSAVAAALGEDDNNNKEDDETTQRKNKRCRVTSQHDLSQDDPVLTLRILDQEGEDIYFKVRQSTRLRRVFECYGQRHGVAPDAFTYLFKGQVIDYRDGATPFRLQMVDGDQIDVLIGTAVESDEVEP